MKPPIYYCCPCKQTTKHVLFGERGERVSCVQCGAEKSVHHPAGAGGSGFHKASVPKGLGQS